LKPIKAKLFSPILFVSSSAASAVSINSTLTFNGSAFPELASFATLYDEARCMNFILHYQPLVSTITAGAAAYTSLALAVEFDPSVSGPSNVMGALESTHNTGPLFLSQGTLSGGGMSPSVQPYRRLRGKFPGPLAPITVSDCPGNAWFALDVTAPVVAVLNGYVDALSAAGVVTVFYFWELECEFRMRT
jgi:hypothetical protein